MADFLKSWWGRWRERRALLAERMTHLDALDRGPTPAGRAEAGRVEAWEAVFSPGTSLMPAAVMDGARHADRCGACGAMIDRRVTVCPVCQAVWQGEAAAIRHERMLFFARWVIFATGGSFVLSEALVWCLAERLPGPLSGWYGEFLGFLETYLWFTFTILAILAATWLYERRSWGPPGHWQPAAVKPAEPPAM